MKDMLGLPIRIEFMGYVPCSPTNDPLTEIWTRSRIGTAIS